MKRRVGRSVLAALVGASAVFGVGTAVGAQEESVPTQPLSWQSAGDSYSSGEGVFGNVGSCAQSEGAYGPVAAARLSDAGWPVSSRTFTACTGHLVEDYFNPRVDAGGKGSLWDWGREQGGPERVDVISMSFGGNDIGFADVLRECLDVPASWVPTTWGEVAPTGCDVSEVELTKRVDDLLDPPRSCEGTRRSGDAGFDCDLDIGERRGSIVDFYYDVATARLSDRGRLYVVGYPRLFAPVKQWPGWIKTGCQGISPGDSEKLGRVAEHFNRKLIEAVDRANAALGEDRVQFVDRLANFAEGQHELCGTGDDYLNGLAADRGQGFGIRLATSFHPNGVGHSSTADDLVEAVRRTFPTRRDPSADQAQCIEETLSVAVRAGWEANGMGGDNLAGMDSVRCDGEWAHACALHTTSGDTDCGVFLKRAGSSWALTDVPWDGCPADLVALGAPQGVADNLARDCLGGASGQSLIPDPLPTRPSPGPISSSPCTDAVSAGDIDRLGALAIEAVNTGDYASVEACASPEALDELRNLSGDGPFGAPSECFLDYDGFNCQAANASGFTVSVLINSGSAGEFITGGKVVGGGM